VLTASGTFGYGEEFAEFVDLNKLGGVIVKGISLKPIKGNPPPRIWETPSGMLNAIGLENPGVEVFLNEKMPYLRKYDTAVFVNMFGYSLEEYVGVAERLDGVPGISGIEVNISCPNVKEGGMAFGTDLRATFELLSAVRKATRLPLIAKLSPNVTDVTAFASRGRCRLRRAVPDQYPARHGHRCALQKTAADQLHGRPVRSRHQAGCRAWWQAARAVSLPIIGMGGIVTGEDAMEFMLAGASAVAVGTAIHNREPPLMCVTASRASCGSRESGTSARSSERWTRGEDHLQPQEQDHHLGLRDPRRDHRRGDLDQYRLPAGANGRRVGR
jgi:dihydroorotate dehydrogenase (NAD+) catalytic subunit